MLTCRHRMRAAARIGTPQHHIMDVGQREVAVIQQRQSAHRSCTLPQNPLYPVDYLAGLLRSRALWVVYIFILVNNGKVKKTKMAEWYNEGAHKGNVGVRGEGARSEEMSMPDTKR